MILEEDQGELGGSGRFIVSGLHNRERNVKKTFPARPEIDTGKKREPENGK